MFILFSLSLAPIYARFQADLRFLRRPLAVLEVLRLHDHARGVIQVIHPGRPLRTVAIEQELHAVSAVMFQAHGLLYLVDSTICDLNQVAISTSCGMAAWQRLLKKHAS